MAQVNKNGLLEIKNLLFRFLREWKWFAFSIMTSLILAIAFIKIVNPVYQVNANVVIKDNDASAATGMSNLRTLGFGLGGSLDINDELEVMNSFSLMRQTVKNLNLNKTETEIEYFVKKTDRYKNSVYHLDIPEHVMDTLSSGLNFTVKTNSKGLTYVKIEDIDGTVYKEKSLKLPVILETPYGDFSLSHTSLYEEGESYKYNIGICNYDIAAEDMKQTVEVFLASKKSNVIAMTLKGTNVEKCKDILNTMIALYNKDALEDKSILANNTDIFISSRLTDLSRELSQAESDVESFKINNNFFNMSVESEVMINQEKEIQDMLISLRTQLSIMDYIDTYLSSEENKYSLLPTSLGIKEESALSAIAEYNNMVLDRMKMLKTTSSTNPMMENMNTIIDALRANVRQSIKNVKEALIISERDLVAKNKLILDRFKDAPTIEKDFREIQRNRSIKERLVVFLLEKKEENAITKAVAEPKAKIIDSAYKNNKPVFPRKLITLAAALMAGALIPVIVILLLDAMKDTFESREELESLTNLPVLGEVCIKDDDEHIVISKESVTPIAELFRLIRGNINFIINKKSENVLLVTSTRSGEGKSFFSINMALSLALISKRILLVGLDIRNPKLSEYMHLNNAVKGITNYLSDDSVEIGEIIMKGVSASNLDVICSGPVPPNPGELLLSDKLDKLIESLKSQYDYIIIDSAPVGMVSDSFALTRLSNMTLYVTRANYTERTNIPFIESLTSQNRLRKMYLVVNGTETKSRYGKAGYGYGYTNSK